MREFRLGTFLTWFLFITCLALIILFVWVLFQYNEKTVVIYFAVLLPASLAMIALAIYGITDMVVGRFIIASDKIILRSPFGYRILMLDEIRGFRRDKNYIRIMPTVASKKDIKVSTYLKDTGQIIEWLAMHYDDLDVVEGDEDEHQVLKNDEFGITEERRLERLNEARKISKIINGGAWVLMIWLFFLPRYYYEFAVLACCLYPVMVIVFALSYRGLISPDEYEKSKMPSAAVAFTMPGFALMLQTFDFIILAYPIFLWGIMVLVSIVFVIAYMLPSFSSVSKPGRFVATGVVIFFLNLVYSYGLLIQANCLLDKSEVNTYETIVAAKHTSKGESTSYYLDLKPWGTLANLQEVKVTRREYEAVDDGDLVVVKQHAGYLKIPWIEVVL